MPRIRSTNPLVTLMGESPFPMYVLDDHRRIVSCNRALTDWLNIRTESLVGQRCDYSSREAGTREEMAASALAPPPQVFAGVTYSAQVVWRNESGTMEQRLATFIPFRGEEPAAVLAVLGEIQNSTASIPTELAQAGDLHERLQQLVQQMRSRFRLSLLVGESPAMKRVRAQVAAAIATPARVLIVGPEGSGREHVARTIAYGDNPDHERPLVVLDAATLQADALEAQLVIANSRAKNSGTKGEQNGPGTWLLLDVDRATTSLQSELISRLRAPTFRPRLIATARRSLIELAASGAFDRELAFALSSLQIDLPSLRERREDIPLLIQRMVEEHNAATGRQLAGFSPGALDRLASLPWYGNVEELAGVVREACQSVSTVWIGEADLPPQVRAIVSAGMHPRRDPEPIELDAFLSEVERELIERAMRTARGNKAQAARLLGVSRARLLRRLEQLGLLVREETAIDFQPESDESDDAAFERELSKED